MAMAEDRREGWWVMGEVMGSMISVGKLPNMGKTVGDAVGNLYWAGNGFTGDGLWIWNGSRNVLIVSREELLTKMTEEDAID